MRVLVTGANGFVGRALVAYAKQTTDMDVRSAVRPSRAVDMPVGDVVKVAGLDAGTDWRQAVRGCDAVVHAAARVHVMRDGEQAPLALYRQVNVDGTLALARQAVAAGVRRFVFLSSIKVNGESTLPGQPFRADDVPAPADPYAISKCEAEDALRTLAASSSLEVVIIRPVLVYGPGVKANFHSMLRWVARGLPLPLARVDNRRSLVAVDNLVNLIDRSIRHANAPGQTLLVSDGEDLSTAELLRRSARAMGVRARLVSVPPAWLEAAARLSGRQSLARRLLGSLQVDIAPTCATLDWQPITTIDDALRRTVGAMYPAPAS
jgi:nucleoside-diphosphate-sugar epimerase